MTRDLIIGFLRIHILHHAAAAPVYGVWLIEELGRHGYRLSPGTLYPILHDMAKDGLLTRSEQVVGGKVRKYYAITESGRTALEEARAKLRELTNEVLGEDTPQPSDSDQAGVQEQDK